MENWLPVPGYESAYSVSDLGRVRSEDRTIRCHRTGGVNLARVKGRILKPTAQHGYPMVMLCDEAGQKQHVAIHRLVLSAFVSHCPSGHEACHNNGDRSDAALTNLRWDTRKANHADKRAHGTQTRGEAHHTARLNTSQVLQILSSSGTQRAIAARFGITQAHVGRIRRRESWQHIAEEA